MAHSPVDQEGEGEKIPLAFPTCAKCQALYKKWTKKYSKIMAERKEK